MTTVRLLIDNLVIRAGVSIAASSELLALPAVAALYPDRSYAWRSVSGVGEAYLDIDLGSVLAVSSVALANVTRLGALGTVKLQQRGDGASPGVAVDVATLPTEDTDTRVAMAFFTEQSHRHWRLVWTNAGAVDAYAELGFVHLGGYIQPQFNFNPRPSLADMDPSTSAASVDGQESFTERSMFGEATLQIKVEQPDLLLLRAAYRRTVGVHSPWFLALDASRPWLCYLVRFAGPLQFQLLSSGGAGAGDVFELDVPWREVR